MCKIRIVTWYSYKVFLKFILVFILVGSHSFASDWYYTVKKGDTLSYIARKYIGVPVFKPHTGSLARLQVMNPQIKDANLIFPTEKIKLVKINREVTSLENAKEAPLDLKNIQLDEDLIVSHNFWIWLGIGTGLIDFSQSSSDLSNLNFSDVGGTSVSAHAGFFFTQNLGLDFVYRDTPGRAKSSSTITVSNGSYHQKMFSGDFLYRPYLNNELPPARERGPFLKVS